MLRLTDICLSQCVLIFSVQGRDRAGWHREAFSLTDTSIFLRQESDSWDPEDNRIVQVTSKMADTIYYMTQYLRKKGPIPVKATRGRLRLDFCRP